MGKNKLSVAAVGAVLALGLAVALVALQGDNGPRQASVATQGAETATVKPLPANPSPQEIEQVMAGLTAQVQASTGDTGGTAPVTKEQVEAQVRALLKQLGITE